MQLKKNYPIINSLRGLAVVLVCTVHFATFNEGDHGRLFEEGDFMYKLGEHSYLSVFVFFVISGFVIPLSLSKYDYHLKKLHRFFFKRWIRIEIPYTVTILSIIFVAVLVAYKNQLYYEMDWGRFFHHLVYTTTIFGREWYSPIFWTLAIEMQFYLVIAFLYLALKQKQQWINYLIVLLFASTSFLLDDIRFLPHYTPMFAQGILLFLLLRGDKRDQNLGILAILMCAVAIGLTTNWSIAFVTTGASLLIGFVNIDWKISNFFGKISYSLYLTHCLAINLLYLYTNSATTMTLKMALFFATFGLTIVLAYFFWLLIEGPTQRLSKNVSL